MTVQAPPAPRLFLIDGYALIYRAFFAMIARPLTTSRGENTSASWGVVQFIERMFATWRPDYVGWVHDAGTSFRHERYPAYKATREKLTEELQSAFDRGMERICDLLEAYRIPIIALDGYEADDVIAALARQGKDKGVNVVMVSGDKDFQQLVRDGIWILNPGRGGAAAVEEQWVSVGNATERLGVPPELVTDYLALVGDSSDNVPGVPGIGDKTARELVTTFGDLEKIIAAAPTITKKRPREALLEHSDRARLSKELVTMRADLPIELDLDALRAGEPDRARLTKMFVELEFQQLARQYSEAAAPPSTAGSAAARPAAPPTHYVTIERPADLKTLIERARAARHIAVATETLAETVALQRGNPLTATLVSLAIAVGEGEAYYLPLRHRPATEDRDDEPVQGSLLIDPSGDRAPTDAPADRGLVAGGDDAAVAVEAPKASRKRKSPLPPPRQSLAAQAIAAGARPVVNLPPLEDAAMRPLVELLQDPTVRKTAQNAKFDLLALERAGVKLEGLDFDVMIASYVLDPGRRSHGVDVLALEFLDHRVTTYEELCGKGKDAVPFDRCPVDCARDYACEDADMTWRMRERFEPQLEHHHLHVLFRDVEMPLVRVLARMEQAGISIDIAWFASLKQRFQKERERIEQEIYAEAGESFNINSNPKLREILFERLKLPVVKRTPTGPSTDASVLEKLAEEGHKLPILLMEYREIAKLENTYLDTLPNLINPATGRLHTSFNQTVASTGRLSSSDPNLQNIPIRRELGRDIRRGFVPKRGWRLLSADYSQIELRLLAHLSGDEAFVAAFHAGGDIHRQTASIIFEVPLDAVTPEMRARAKTINFATIYGQGPHALSQQLKIAHAEAKAFIERYFERFGGVRRFLDAQIEFARTHGYVETLFGRRRYIPELRDRNYNIRAFGERTAQNSPIQGSAADLIKLAMINVDRAIAGEGLEARMLLQVHDELVFEAPAGEIERVDAVVRKQMETAADLRVPLVVDVGLGNNWMETKEH